MLAGVSLRAGAIAELLSHKHSHCPWWRRPAATSPPRTSFGSCPPPLWGLPADSGPSHTIHFSLKQGTSWNLTTEVHLKHIREQCEVFYLWLRNHEAPAIMGSVQSCIGVASPSCCATRVCKQGPQAQVILQAGRCQCSNKQKPSRWDEEQLVGQPKRSK